MWLRELVVLNLAIWEFTLLNASSRAQCMVRPNKLKHQSLELRKVYCRVMQGDGWIVPLNPKFLKEFQQSTFKGKVREGMIGCCQVLDIGILCSCNCPCGSGHDISVNLEMLFSVLKIFISV